jgi:hypothetical protein
MNKSDGCKSVPDVDFHHRLFEVVIDLDHECGGWLPLVKRTETSSMFFKAANNTTSSTWKTWVMWCEGQMWWLWPAHMWKPRSQGRLCDVKYYLLKVQLHIL